MLLIPKSIKSMFLAVLHTKLYVLIIDLANQSFSTEEKNAVNKFIEAILKENEYCKKIIKKHFNINLVMSAEDEKSFK